MASGYEQWARSLDERVFGGLNTTFANMRKPLVALVAISAILGMLVFTRFLVQSIANKAPPVFEGVPFIGGILKFAKVSR